MLLEALALPDQGSLQDNAALPVALAVLGGKLIDPAQFAVAVLAAHVPDHVAAGEHDPILNFTVLQIDHLVKKKGPSCGPCKASGDELGAVGQDRVAVCAGEQASATNVIQKNSSHFYNLSKFLLKTAPESDTIPPIPSCYQQNFPK